MLELEQRRQEFDLKLDRRNRNFNIWMTCVLILFAALQLAAAILQVDPDTLARLMAFFGNQPPPNVPPLLNIPGGF